MYLVGERYPKKVQTRAVLHQLLVEGRSLVTDADVVYPVTLPSLERGHSILESHAGGSARDAIHVTVMEAKEIGAIVSFNTGFDSIPLVTRVGR